MRVLCAPYLYVWCLLKNIENPTSPKWYNSKCSQNVRKPSPLKRRHPAYVTLLVKSPFCPRCWKNLPHIVHHIYFWTTTCKHIIALPVFIGKPTSFRNGFNHTLYIEPIKRLLQAKHSGKWNGVKWNWRTVMSVVWICYLSEIRPIQRPLISQRGHLHLQGTQLQPNHPQRAFSRYFQLVPNYSLIVGFIRQVRERRQATRLFLASFSTVSWSSSSPSLSILPPNRWSWLRFDRFF